MEINIFDSKNEKVQLAEPVFAAKYNEALVHQIVTAYLAKARAGTRAQKTRSEVRGGGKKPWKQKGTGRARAGTIRSPLWRKGGMIFAAKPQDFSQKVNKKSYKAAMRSILSELLRAGFLHVIKPITLKEPKTKLLVAALKKLNITSSAMLIIKEYREDIFRAGNNIPDFTVLTANDINPYSLMKYEHILIEQDALAQIEEHLA